MIRQDKLELANGIEENNLVHNCIFTPRQSRSGTIFEKYSQFVFFLQRMMIISILFGDNLADSCTIREPIGLGKGIL